MLQDVLAVFVAALIIFIVAAACLGITSVVILLAWNGLAVPLFGAQAMEFWQAVVAALLLFLVSGMMR